MGANEDEERKCGDGHFAGRDLYSNHLSCAGDDVMLVVQGGCEMLYHFGFIASWRSLKLQVANEKTKRKKKKN